MAVDEIVVSATPGETRAAFLEGGRLCRFEFARPDEGARLGDVYWGRVTTVVAGMAAAFVNIGDARAGFLALAEARPANARGGRIEDYVSEGEAVLVQVLREPEAGKGAKLTARPALAGRFLVLSPGGTDVRPSRRMIEAGGADRIAGLAARLPRTAGGWRVRRAAFGADDEMVAREAGDLAARWDAIARRRATAPPPMRIGRGPDPVIAAVVDQAPATVRRIVVDDPRTLAALRGAVPDLAERMAAVAASLPLFAARGIDEQIEASLAPVLSLPSGGVVTFAETAAVVAIDVDTAATFESNRETTALKTNLEAAATIARGIAVRDLAGHIVIDFVAMKRRNNRARVMDALRQALADDPRETQVAGFTRLGLVELTRRRRRPSLGRRLMSPCPSCRGDGQIKSATTAASEALRAVVAEDRARPGCAWRIEAAPAVISALREQMSGARAQVEARLGRPLRLEVRVAPPFDTFTVTALAAERKANDG